MAIGSWPPVVTGMPRVTRQTGRVTEEEDVSPAPAVAMRTRKLYSVSRGVVLVRPPPDPRGTRLRVQGRFDSGQPCRWPSPTRGTRSETRARWRGRRSHMARRRAWPLRLVHPSQAAIWYGLAQSLDAGNQDFPPGNGGRGAQGGRARVDRLGRCAGALPRRRKKAAQLPLTERPGRSGPLVTESC